MPEMFGDTMLANGTVYPQADGRSEELPPAGPQHLQARFLNLQFYVDDGSAGMSITLDGVTRHPATGCSSRPTPRAPTCTSRAPRRLPCQADDCCPPAHPLHGDGRRPAFPCSTPGELAHSSGRALGSHRRLQRLRRQAVDPLQRRSRTVSDGRSIERLLPRQPGESGSADAGLRTEHAPDHALQRGCSLELGRAHHPSARHGPDAGYRPVSRGTLDNRSNRATPAAESTQAADLERDRG